MTQKERMEKGLVYDATVNDIMSEQVTYLDAMYRFNLTAPTELEKREALLKEMLGSVGEGCYIEPPFYANWGGRHVHLGNPCRVLRELNDHDREYYYRDRKIDWDTLK